ncbi:MAG: transcription-repair coupling factor [Rikenellaceae bacterium]|nr:transcription-repair coupling factor [Rikenellaceae bacterium]
MHKILQTAVQTKPFAQLQRELKQKGNTVYLNELVGGALSFYLAAAVAKTAGLHIVVAEDRDQAAYLMNDLYALLDEKRVLFFPSAYKRSILYGQEEAQSVVMRTNAINAVQTLGASEYLVLCTYPEALAERVVGAAQLDENSVDISCGDTIKITELVDVLESLGFERVDFVYEPGQYSVRGGIVDIFSYVESKPYRLDFFGDEVDSLRRFEIGNQLSSDRLDSITIIGNVNRSQAGQVSIAAFVGEGARYWFYDADYALRKVDDVRVKYLNQSDEPERATELLTSRVELLRDMQGSTLLSLHNNIVERPATATIQFHTQPQRQFSKNFEMLADDITARKEEGFSCYILSDNLAQMERLDNIFYSLNRQGVKLEMLRVILHEGFVDYDTQLCLYTEHQLFDRYRRYKINGEIKRDEQMTVAELNALRVGDYIVHIDHGVGRFDGLVTLPDPNGGKPREVIKLVYRDGDVLFINVHSLHCISRYKSGDGERPKVHKLGSGAWQKLKTATKRAVKDISRELIALYAKRKASEGFAFSEDSYLQQAMEASFRYEETADQQRAIEAVKSDMESSRPMDRLICGDVGFGKTEVAIRAAFKAAVDGKQVAVLVPTTILALQHYRSFTERLRDMPVRVEYLNRSKSAKQTRQIAEELESGKIDILIGTHKMLGSAIKFRDLGLLIIDEEQRFGVAAKEKLTQMSVNVDTLTLTATPIPRTLQFSLMGSRDLSVISTPPPNRQPIITESHTFSEELVQDAVEAELSRGGQVYFIHNNVEQLEDIRGMISRLCPKARVVAAHGRMKAGEMEKLIMDFIYGESDVLVATSIIESGVDIPNVNTIIINNADRFGLSNLHQLRGRVGRSDRKAYCYLLSKPDELLSSDARRRLRAIEEFSDLGSGFNIAMQDLDIRGAGNLLGAEQSGFIADIGFETYQKIMNEAIAELRAEGLDVAGLSHEEQKVVDRLSYVDDVAVELGVDASLPADYVQQSAERLRLYRELDSIVDQKRLEEFEARLVDRFGRLPDATRQLLDVVRLRWVAAELGIERVKVKNGLMIVNFVGDDHSPFYKTEQFMNLLRKVTAQPERFVLKQRDTKLAMTVRQVATVADGVRVLQDLKS